MDNPRIQFKKLQLPSQTQHSARLNNLLLNKTAAYGFALDGGKLCRFRMIPGDMDTQHICPISLTLEVGNTMAGLWLSEWPLLEKINQFVPDGMLQKLPENLAISVVENALAPLLYQASEGLGLKLGVQSMSAGLQGSAYSLPFGFEIQIVSQGDGSVAYHGTGLLLLDPQLYPHLQQRLGMWPSDTNQDWEEHVTPLKLEISRAVLSMQEINELQVSDLILLDDTRFQHQGLLRVCADSGYCCEARFTSLEKTAITINSEWNPMNENEQKQSVDHIGQVPVQLSFDLGQKTLSFNEVRQLRPGYVLELGSSLPEVVQIRSQNRLLGTGELVEINGRIGVRVLSLFSKKAKGG